jgi:hypothetical protein
MKIYLLDSLQISPILGETCGCRYGNELRDFLACLLKKIWHFTEEYFDSLQGTERGIMSRPQNVFPPMAHYYI